MIRALLLVAALALAACGDLTYPPTHWTEDGIVFGVSADPPPPVWRCYERPLVGGFECMWI